MTKDEAKAYYRKTATEAGVDADTIAAVEKAFDNDKFSQAFVPRPEVDRSLDSVRTEADRVKNYYEKEWYPKAKEAYDTNLKGIQLLDKYRQTYGDLDDTKSVKQASDATGLSKEEIRQLLKEEMNGSLATRDRATLDLMEIREQHMDTFKKRLPMKDFEAFVEKQQKSGEYTGLRAAYRDFTEPDMEKNREASMESRIKQAKEEAVRDFASRNKIPSDPRPKEPHLIFDRKVADTDKSKGTNGKSGREAFMEVMNDPDPDTVRQRYPS